MTIASSNFTTLAYQEEYSSDNGGTYGTKPTTGAFRLMPYTGETLQFSKESISSNNITSSRQISDVIQTGFSVSGGINLELSAKTFDEWIEGAMWSRWSTPVNETSLTLSVVGSTRTVTSASGTPFANLVSGQFIRISGSGLNASNVGIFQISEVTSDTVIVITDAYTMADDTSVTSCTVQGSMIRNGTTRISYYMEKSLTDLATVQRFSYSGLLVNSLSVSAQSSSILTGAIDLMGKTSTAYTGATESAGTVLSSVGDNILNAVSHVAGVRIDGVEQTAAGVYFQGLDFSLGNNLRGVQAIGTLGNIDVSPGQLEVGGSMNTYFANDDMYEKYLADTEFSLSYEVLDDNNEGYIFSFPRTVVSGSSMSAGGNDQDLIENMSWSALKSASTNIAPSISIQIDRIQSDYTTSPDQV